MWKEIVKQGPCHVIIGGWYPRSHALLALLLRLSGVSIGVRSDNTLEHTDLRGMGGILKRAFMSVWLGLYDVWHPVGSLSHAYLRQLSIRKRETFYFPYAIDMEWFVEKSMRVRAERDRRREELGLQAGDYVVIGVMKWSHREDPVTLINAMLLAVPAVPNIKLVLVGDGPLRQKVEARKSIAPERIITPGYVKYSELPQYYSVADIFVHPAESEPYGVSVQEAMACGLPVIVSDMVGAAADLLERGKNGDVFPVGQERVLAKLIVAYAARLEDKSIAEASQSKANERSYSYTIGELERCMECSSDGRGRNVSN